MELMIKGWTADAVLAISWASFSWYYPLFAMDESDTMTDIAAATVLYGCPGVTLGLISIVVPFIYYTWGVTDDEDLTRLLMRGHVIASWLSKIIYVIGFTYTRHTGLRLLVCGFSLGQSMCTPNSMIMILSVSPHEVIAYTAFAQISFIFITYGGSMVLNYYGTTFFEFPISFAIIVAIISTICLIILSAWTIYEFNYNVGPDEMGRFTIRRRVTALELNEFRHSVQEVSCINEKPPYEENKERSSVVKVKGSDSSESRDSPRESIEGRISLEGKKSCSMYRSALNQWTGRSSIQKDKNGGPI